MDTRKRKGTTQLFRLGFPVALLLFCTFLIWLTDAELRLAGVVYEADGGAYR